MSKALQRSLNSDDVLRRLQFLLAEAGQKSPIYDQTVRYALRVVTNFYCTGRDCSSEWYRRNSKYRSFAANELIRQHSASGPGDDSWLNEVTNEHQEPLVEVWKWMCETGNLAPDELAERLQRWPMVVITKGENDKLRKLKSVDPTQRYLDAKIKVVCLDESGCWRERVI